MTSLDDKHHFQVGTEMILPEAHSTLDLGLLFGYSDFQWHPKATALVSIKPPQAACSPFLIHL